MNESSVFGNSKTETEVGRGQGAGQAELKSAKMDVSAIEDLCISDI